MQSIRFFSRVRTSKQRGYVLITALVLAVLYFALMELILIDSQRALAEANRFRSRIMAMTEAENTAELAAWHMTSTLQRKIETKEARVVATGEYRRTGENFEIRTEAEVIGVFRDKASLFIQGRVVNNVVKIDYSFHSQ